VVEQHVRLAIMERYRLLPYLYTQFRRYHAEGLPIIRSLAIMYPENPDMYWRSSEFFLGDSLYIAPVHHPGESGRFLYMPHGPWYSLWTDAPAPASGEEVWVSTPMSRIPVFVRGGHLIPRWPVQQYTGQQASPHTTYDLWWAPECSATSYHYEDSGDGQAYRIGMYRMHRFHYSSTRRSITIVREGEGNLDPTGDTATLALHALPIGAQPSVVADGAPCPGSFGERHVYSAEIPMYSNRVEITI
jgi:alpha-glucosidase